MDISFENLYKRIFYLLKAYDGSLTLNDIDNMFYYELDFYRNMMMDDINKKG